MSLYKFEEDDLFNNTIISEPQYSFYTYSASVYINNVPHLTDTVRDTNSENIQGVPNGYISLYEYNIDRPSGNNIHPFLSKEGYKDAFKTTTKLQ